jgi:hypothetical protein
MREFQFFESIIENTILYIEGEKCMIFPKVQFVARGRSPRATKHRGKNEHSLQKYTGWSRYNLPKNSGSLEGSNKSKKPLFIRSKIMGIN